MLVTDGFNTNYNYSNTFSINPVIVSLAVDSVQKVYSNGTLNIFEAVMYNNGSSTINDVSWIFDTGEGTYINSSSNLSSMLASEKAFVYVKYNYSDGSTYNIGFNASGVRQSNVINAYLSSVFEIGDLLITSFQKINSELTNVIYETQVKNILSDNINNVNWSLLTGEGVTIDSQYLLNVSPNESVFFYINYDYGSGGTFSPEFYVQNPNYEDNKVISIDIRHLESLNVSIVNETNTKRIFEYVIKNFLNQNLTSVNWTFDTKNSNVINSTISSVLQPSEQMFIYINYNFTTTGTYNVNATATNGTLADSKNLTVTI